MGMDCRLGRTSIMQKTGGMRDVADKSLANVVNAQIVGTNLRTRRVKANDAFLGIDFAKHGKHAFQIIVI